MKKIIFALILAFGVVLSATAQSGGVTKAAFTRTAQAQILTSAVCGMCKTTLEKAMAYEKGVKAAELDVESKLLTVVYQPDKTSVDKLRLAISRAGYDADSVQADARAHQRLPDCCQKTAAPHAD
ncbi:MAG: cation transporter [Hymenobacteraceae bacterium]|nr:cation transporter [Hymenobacteraceae bacterium]